MQGSEDIEMDATGAQDLMEDIEDDIDGLNTLEAKFVTASL